ncbi:protein phosphatase [Ceratobasidium sp. AG-Ba]|nr:protein phosphatase [Ceratobasidium sp. AG-Ba]
MHHHGRHLPSIVRRCVHTAARRPYNIEVGVSFAGKPSLKAQVQPKRKTVAFPDNHPIAQWRNAQLKWENRRLKIDSAGEDFFYVQKAIHDSGFSLGVSDGVGGWSDDGVDPSLFSQALMYFSAKHASTSWAGEPDFDPIEETGTTKPTKSLSPKDIISNAYQDVLDEPAVQWSSTACVVNIDAQTGRLSAANLGDSSFSILRSSSIFHEQKPQTHYFNCPRQLAKLLPSHRLHLRIRDLPEHADGYSAQLRHGDLVVLSTDGLGDNVHPVEMIGLAALMGRQAASKPDQNLAQMLADGLVEYAIACMHSQEKVSPFEVAARKEGMEYEGGYFFSVTVIVAHISENL